MRSGVSMFSAYVKPFSHWQCQRQTKLTDVKISANYARRFKRLTAYQRRVVCGDWPAPWKLHEDINLRALFNVGATRASNAT